MSDEMSPEEYDRMLISALAGEPISDRFIEFAAANCNSMDLTALIAMMGIAIDIGEQMLAEDLEIRARLDAAPVPEEEKAPLRRELDEIQARTVAHLESSRRALAKWTEANCNRN